MEKRINLNEENISIVELLEKEMRKRHTFTQSDIELFEQAKEMQKQREKSIFSIAYRMMPKEYGKEYCEAEFEKFIQLNL